VAGYLMLITSLPATAQPAERIVSLDRHRRQVQANQLKNAKFMPMGLCHGPAVEVQGLGPIGARIRH
jgi:hypothetical protein